VDNNTYYSGKEKPGFQPGFLFVRVSGLRIEEKNFLIERKGE